MALYLIGDLQGCHTAFERLLQRLDYSPSRDTVYLLGDLVNRGPDSAAVLRRLMALGTSAHCVLGNHDLHLLAAAHGSRRPSRRDTLQTVLHAPDRDALLAWLRQQNMALHAHGVLMVHAGVLPGWTLPQTLALAGEVESVLQGDSLPAFLDAMYGNQPAQWHDDLAGFDRLRAIVNALTRLRYCTADGVMDLETSVGPPPSGYMPWFDVPGRATAAQVIAFGHWSTLGWLPGRTDVYSLDSGCVWGGQLTALRLGATAAQHERITVACEQAQPPGE